MKISFFKKVFPKLTSEGKPNFIRILFLLFLLSIVFLIIKFRWFGESGADWQFILSGDGKGYFSYLEQIFISGNFGKAPVDNIIVNSINGSSVIKFPWGTALLWLPFFLISKLISSVFLLNNLAETEIYLKLISISSLVYYFSGSIALFNLLRKLTIKRWSSLTAILVFFFGTNLMIYVTFLPSMSHCYSYFAISCFLLFSYRYIEKADFRNLLLTSIFFGLIYLIRPVNIMIILFIPFFFNSLPSFLGFLKKNFKGIITFLILSLFVCSVQHILWYIQCGRFFIWSYQNEGFYFLNPEIINFLFSFRKGLFIYTPLIALALLAAINALSNIRYKIIVFLIFTVFIVYILSSWWCWTYFDSYSSRPIVDFLPVFIIAFAFTIQNLNRALRFIIFVVTAVFILLNCIQSYQYSRKIIHPEYMSFESYKYVFLKTSTKYESCVGGVYDIIPYNKYHKKPVYDSHLNIQKTELSANNSETVFGRSLEFGCGIDIQINTEIYFASKIYAEISFEKKDNHINSAANALLVVAVSNKENQNEYYYSCSLNYLPDKPEQVWLPQKFSLIIPKLKNPDSKISFYIWNKELEAFSIKDFRVMLFTTDN